MVGMRAALVVPLLIACFAGTAAAGVKTSADTLSEVVTELGRESYIQYCAACHGADARGGGPVGATLKIAPTDLTGIAQRRDNQFPERDIANLIDGRSMPSVHGTREMPVWGRRFSAVVGGGEVGEESVRGQLLILVEYLRSIQR